MKFLISIISASTMASILPASAEDIGQCQSPATLISTIQGTGNASPEIGQTHAIEAVITAKRDTGFFVQEETADHDERQMSSEALFVEGQTDLPIGNHVRVVGQVSENFEMTTLVQLEGSEVVDCGAAAPLSAVPLELPFNKSLESLEGMLVKVTKATVTSTANLWRYGDIVVSDDFKRTPSDIAVPLSSAFDKAVKATKQNLLVIEDDNNSHFPSSLSYYPEFSYAKAIRIGDHVSATGPLNQGVGVYRVNPVSAIEVDSSRMSKPTVEQGNLTIATFNVLNYFNGKITSDGSTTFDYKANRGAKSAEAFAIQQARIVDALNAINTDVIGLMEVENDGFDKHSAIQTLVDALNQDRTKAQQYEFVSTTNGLAIGTDAITVGVLYKPSVVTPDGAPLIIEMPRQQVSEGRTKGMRPSLIQTFTHPASGQQFAVSVNHFKSKGSGCVEDSADTISEVDKIQGRCNALRVSAAVKLGHALEKAELPKRLVILGDLNAYSAEDPLAVLSDYSPQKRGYAIKTAVNTELDEGQAIEVERGFGYHSMAEIYDDEGFSYWWSGSEQVGSLDHMLVTDTLVAEAVDAKHWNINSVEAYQLQYNQALEHYPSDKGYQFADIGPYRSSDHDPMIVAFNLRADDAPLNQIQSAPASSSSRFGGTLFFAAGLLTLVCVYRRLFKR